MRSYDWIVIGGGISGARLAARVAASGGSVLVLERETAAGGCLASVRREDGYWFELGAHTAYNSYRGLVGALEEAGTLPKPVERAPSVLRLLDGDRVLPGKNLGLLLRQLGLIELALQLPRWIGNRPDGKSVREYYGRFVGARNFERVLGPILSAVPSQRADDFPATMLFKKRERRGDLPRSFTFEGGLRTAVEALLRAPGLELRCDCEVSAVARAEGGGFLVSTPQGELRADRLGLAVPPSASARLLRPLLPDAAELAGGIAEVTLHSVGFALRADETTLPPATFLIPRADNFHSIVTRDPVPDPAHRALTFHFRPEADEDARRARIAALLGRSPAALPDLHERRATLPSPVLGHAARVAALDRLLAPHPIAVTGNWFEGLSIEDCVLRSQAEFERVRAL